MAVSSNGHSTNGAGRNGEPVLRAVLEGLQAGRTQDVLDALKTSAQTPPALQAVIDQANLKPEQTAIFNLLMALRGGEGAADAGTEETVPAEARAPEAGTRLRRLRNIKRELADLREVNDTLAAALGACHVCWGGDENCDECEGYGRPGSRPPDPHLFERLVAPAIRRARMLRGSRDRVLTRARR